MPAKSSFMLPLLTGLFWLAAFVLCLVSAIRCDFVQFTADTTDDGQVVSRGFGLWWYQYWFLTAVSDGGGTDLYVVESCASYPDSLPLDAAWKASQAFNIIIVILAFVTLILICVASCAVDDEEQTNASLVRFSPPIFLTMALCQGLNLLFLSSKACGNNPLVSLGGLSFPIECSLATGAKCCIAAMFFWFAAAGTSFLEAKALKEGNVGGDGDLSAPLNL